MATLARISEFDLENDSFIEYAERFDNFLFANKIEDENLKKSTFIASIGAPAYKLLRSLCQNDTKSKSYTQLIALLTEHLNPTPNEIAKRFSFYKRDRKSGESVNEYIAELRRLSENCNFGVNLDTYLHDRFVCGLNSESVQQKLLTIKTLTLDSALETARSFEKAYKDARAIRGGPVEENIHRVDVSKRKEGDKRECYRCGSTYHLANKCGFLDSTCFGCGKKGHTKRMCKNVGKPGGNEKKGTADIKELSGDVEVQQGTVFRNGDEVEDDLDFLKIYRLARDNEVKLEDPVMVDVEINGKAASMELDTGAVVTVMGDSQFKRYSNVEFCDLEETNYRLRSWTGEIVKPEGVGKVEVDYEGQVCQLPVTVVKGDYPTLLGRDWLKHLHLNWGKLIPVKTQVNKVSEVDSRIDGIIEKFPEVFTPELGCLKDFKVSIPVKDDSKPKFCKARPVPYALRSRVEEELDRLEEQGVYEKVAYSKWASPIVTVLKDANDVTGPIRICGDYKVSVNKCALLDSYPIPNTVDQFATLHGGQKFTKLDLSQAYQQLELDEAARELLTINTHRGLYRPRRLQFGIHSATGIFQREMDKRLRHIPFVIVRVDEILVSGRNDAEHLHNLKVVLSVLKEAGLTVKLPKCSFLQPQVTYCGYVVSEEGVKPMPENVEAVFNAPTPTNVTEVRSFMGMVNYYNSYLRNLATISEPLHKLLRKDVPWKWCNDCQKAFDAIKQALCEAPLLVHFDPSKHIVVQVDASPFGVGAILSHIMEDGEEKPVSYKSRTLSVAERGYGHVEREGLALVFAMKKFHQFLYGLKFLMFTDHKPLLGLFSETSSMPGTAAARILRWAVFLAGYNYELKYRPGEANGNADALSRLPLDAKNGDLSKRVFAVAMMELVNAPVTEKEVRSQSKVDPVLNLVINLVLDRNSKVDSDDEKLKPYLRRLSELSCQSGCLLWGSRVVIPETLRKKILDVLHEVHVGVSRMKALARSYVWWPNMDMEIEHIVKECNTCQENQRSPAKSPSHHWEFPTHPWERIHVDHAGPVNGKNFFVVVDSHSKWIETDLVRSDSKSAIAVLRRLFATHGLPRVLVSDNGTGFTSQEFADFMTENGIKHVFSAPYHPASNRQAEGTVRTMKEAMKCLKGDDVEKQLCKFLFKYRITPHSTTGTSPAELLVGRRLRSALSLLKPDLVLSMREKQLDSLKSKKTRHFEIEQPVFIKNYGVGKSWIPGVVVSSSGNVNYKILTSDGRLLHRHVDQVVPRGSGIAQEESLQVPPDDDFVPVEFPTQVPVQDFAEKPLVDNVVVDASAESDTTNIVPPVTRDIPSNISASPNISGRPVRENKRKPARYR